MLIWQIHDEAKPSAVFALETRPECNISVVRELINRYFDWLIVDAKNYMYFHANENHHSVYIYARVFSNHLIFKVAVHNRRSQLLLLLRSF